MKHKLILFAFLLIATVFPSGYVSGQQAECPGWNNPTNFTTGNANYTYMGAGGTVTWYQKGSNQINYPTWNYNNYYASQLDAGVISGTCSGTGLPYPGNAFVILDTNSIAVGADDSLRNLDPNTDYHLPFVPTHFNTYDTSGTYDTFNTHLTRSIRIGDNCANYSNGASKLTYEMFVTQHNALLFVYYALVAQYPSHGIEIDPSFRITVLRQTSYDTWQTVNDVHTNSPEYDYFITTTPAEGQGITLSDTSNHYGTYTFAPDFETDGWHMVGTGYNAVVYKDWEKVVINLSNLIAEKVRIEVSIGDCGYNAHYAYAYICGECRPMRINVLDNDTNQTPAIATLSAPRGMLNYEWGASRFGMTNLYDIQPYGDASHFSFRTLASGTEAQGMADYNVQPSDFQVFYRNLPNHDSLAVQDSLGNSQTFRCRITSALNPDVPITTDMYINVSKVYVNVSVLSNNTEQGTVSGGGRYPAETTATTLWAYPKNGFVFAGWSDGDMTNPRTIHLTGDTTLTALFDSIIVTEFVDGDFIFSDAAKTRLKRYIGNGGDVVIPSTVVLIEDSAFFNNQNITSVLIPSSVTSIGSCAFYVCSLTSANIPDSVTFIGDYAFFGCNDLLSVTIPSTITNISNYAFYGCSSLTEITIPNTVTSIGHHAFSGCTGLTSLFIPSSVSVLGTQPFTGCSGLTSIIVESGNNNYDSRDNCNAIIKTDENILITGCQNTIIPNTVTSIGFWAFGSCDNLTSISIPNSVTHIGPTAFAECGLTEITLPNSVVSIGSSSFMCCRNLLTVVISDSVQRIEYGAFANCNNLSTVNIPSTVTYIGQDAFSKVRHIEYYGDATGAPWGALSMNDDHDGDFVFADSAKTYVMYYIGAGGDGVIPSTATTLGNNAFQGHMGVTSVTIPNSVVNIGDWCFGDCSNLMSVIFGDSVSNIGSCAFSSCNSLSSVNLPYSVTHIAQNAFQACSGLISVHCVSEIPPTIEYGIFNNCNSDLKVYVPCESINDYYNSWNGVISSFDGHSVSVSQLLHTTAPEFDFTFISSNEDYGTVQIGEVDCDSNVTIEAVVYDGNTNVQFTGWSDGSLENPRTIHLTSDTNIMALFEASYCTPNPTSRDAQGITAVAFGGMTNDTIHPQAAPFYGDYTSMQGGFAAGTTASVDITYATGYTYGTIIWVDWNRDKFFDESEIVYSGMSTNAKPTTLTASFHIPLMQDTGLYRMRIAGADSKFDSYINNGGAAPASCFTSTWAVSEDYTLLVTEAVSCPEIASVSTGEVGSSSVTLGWVDEYPGTRSYTIYNMSDSSVIATGITDSNYTVTGLTGNTVYTFGVQANCSDDEATGIVTTSMRTECDIIRSLPWTEDFENVPDGSAPMPYCWERYQSAKTTSYDYPYSYNSSDACEAHTGSRYLFFTGSTSSSYPDTMVAILPELDTAIYLMSGNGLTFWASGSRYVYVGTMSDPTDMGTFTPLDTVFVNTREYTKYTVPLAGLTDPYIALMVLKGNGSNILYIDDLAIAQFYSVAVSSSDTALGLATGGGDYESGSTITLYAIPSGGSTFAGWSNGSTSNPLQVTVTGDTIVTAYFTDASSLQPDTVYVHDTTTVEVPVHDTTVVIQTDTVTLVLTDTLTVVDTLVQLDTVTLTEYVPVHDTTYIDVHDTTYVDVHDTTYIDVPYAVHDTTYVDVFVHDTTVLVDTVTLTEYVPVHDTTYIDVHDTTYVDVHDTTYIDVPYAVHDTTVVVDTLTLTEYVPVHDTTYIDVHDTTYIDVPYAVHDTTVVVDTLTLTEYVPVHDTTYVDVHDTTYIDVFVHDTTIVTLTDTVVNTVYDTTILVDTVTQTEYVPVHDTTYVDVHDTTYIDVHDTTYIDVPYAVHDTTYIDVHDTTYIDVFVHDTTYIDVPYAVHDTTYIDVPYAVHDTTIVVDTLTLTEYVPVHDTTYVDVFVHDTTIVSYTDTVTKIDTLYDFLYIEIPVFDTTFITLTDTIVLTEYIEVPVHDTTVVTLIDTISIVQIDTIVAVDTLVQLNTVTLTEYVPVHDTTYIDVHDTTYIDVHDTTYIDVHDTTYIDVHDTTYIDVPYAVHDTTIVVDTLTLTEYVPVHDTTYIDVFVHDTTIVTLTDTLTLTEYVPVHDTTYIDVHDTTYIDVHDTTYIDVPYAVHDTTIVVDTLTLTEYVPVHDTTYIDVLVHDTTIVTLTDTLTLTEYVPVHDTTVVTITDTVINTVYDTVVNTVYDTVDNYIYDTITNTVYDTVTNTIYDTVTNTVYDTVDNYIYDTTLVTDTLWLTLYDTVYITDTIIIHDTVYVQNGIDDVQTANIRLYQRGGSIVVEDVDGSMLPEVRVYDAVGREISGKMKVESGKMEMPVPASGVYLVKVGDRPARRIVVIR